MSGDQKLLLVLTVGLLLLIPLGICAKGFMDWLSPPTPQEDCMDQARQMDNDEELEAYRLCLESLVTVVEPEGESDVIDCKGKPIAECWAERDRRNGWVKGKDRDEDRESVDSLTGRR